MWVDGWVGDCLHVCVCVCVREREREREREKDRLVHIISLGTERDAL